MMSMRLTLLFPCLAFLGLSKFGHVIQTQVCGSSFFSERLSNHYQVIPLTFSEMYTKYDAVLLTDPSRNPIRPDTRLQMKVVENSKPTHLRQVFCTDSQDTLLL
jgi:hypothetical protein